MLEYKIHKKAVQLRNRAVNDIEDIARIYSTEHLKRLSVILWCACIVGHVLCLSGYILLAAKVLSSSSALAYQSVAPLLLLQVLSEVLGYRSQEYLLAWRVRESTGMEAPDE